MRRTLDGYVARAIAASFVASLVFFLFLSILIDILNRLGDYIDAAESKKLGTIELFWFLAKYYSMLVPVQLVVIAPFAAVIGCMFAIARLMSQNELQPMLFVGRSMMRVLRPALLVGALSGLGMAACWQWVVPAVAGEVTAFKDFLDGGKSLITNVVLEATGDTGYTRLRIEKYDTERQRLEGVYMLRADAATRDVSLVHAAAATWDAASRDWRLDAGFRRTTEGETSCDWLGESDWDPAAVLQRGRESVDCELFSYTELAELRELRPTRRDVALALHRHVTYPLANLILMMLALPFAIHFERGSRIERVLGAIGICAAYLIFDLICQNLGLNGYIHPVVAAWSPTILFGALGVTMFGSIRT